MKKYLLYILCGICATGAMAQNHYNGSGLPSGPGGGHVTKPLNFSEMPVTPSGYNFTRTYMPLKPMSTIPVFPFTAGAPIHIVTQYKGGFGQPLMTISGNGSSKDILKVEDDRPSLTKADYLPYPVAPRSTFKPNAYSEQESYYQGLYPAEGKTAYSKSILMPNGGNPIEASYSPGKAFVGDKRGTSISSGINGSSEVYKLQYSGGQICRNGYYGSNQLKYRKTEGQHGQLAYDYADKSNRLVCRKVAAGTGKWHYTYYIYNDMGKLIFIVPPKAAEIVNASSCIDATTISKLCYGYKYDDHGRLIEKSTAGKDGVETLIYNNYDLPVLVQTPLMAQRNQWQFTIHDEQDRAVFTGTYSGNVDAAYWRGIIAGTTSPINYGYPASQTLEHWIVNGLKNYTYPTGMFLADAEIESINYYDKHQGRFIVSPQFTDTFSGSFLTSLPLPTVHNYNYGKLVGTEIKIIESPASVGSFPNNWVATALFYDEKGRVIQTQTQNPWTSDLDITTNQYDFPGRVVVSVGTHNKPAADKPYTKIATHNFYGEVTGRLDSVYQKIDNDNWQPIYTLRYDDLGRVQTKWLGNIEQQNYTYNIRGQLIGINANGVLDSTTHPSITYRSSHHYETGFEKPRFDGAFSGFMWRSASSAPSYYGYEYDTVGRMTRADYQDYSRTTIAGPKYWNNTNRDFTVSNLSYDVNGNMLTMKQRGYDDLNLPGDIDVLTYSYDGNRLMRVEDAGVGSPTQDFSNGNSGSDDYRFDVNGNLIADANKYIDSIGYNTQDLPLMVEVSSGGKIENTYSAGGTLIKKVITDSTGVQTFEYWGGFVYKNDSLQYISHAEGRVRYQPDSVTVFKYDYFVKDHLGNVRTVVTADTWTETSLRYHAGFEVLAAVEEESLFDNIGNVRDNNPAGSMDNTMAARLHGAEPEHRVAASLLLHGMSGDEISIGAVGYYEDTSSTNMNTYAPTGEVIESLLNALTGGIIVSETEGNTYEVIEQTIGALLSPNNTMLYEDIKNGITDPAYPRSYLNVLIFDEEFNLQAEACQVIQLKGFAGQWNELNAGALDMPINGYCLTFLSTESDMPVYFDEVTTVHRVGRLLEEQHYYPHGLRIEAGSSNMVTLKNKYLYQGKLMQDELGLQLYDFHARQYDPQIGRFWGLDPADQYPSGYTGMGNDPANMIDPSGMYAIDGGGYSTMPGVVERNRQAQYYMDPAIWQNGRGVAADLAPFSSDIGFGESQERIGRTEMEIMNRDIADVTTTVIVIGDVEIDMTPSAKDSKKDLNNVDPTKEEKTDEDLQKEGKERKSIDEMSPEEVKELYEQAKYGDGEFNNNCALSDKGVEFIQQNEGFESKVYTDVNGHKTIGYGHKLLPNESFKNGVSKSEASNLFRSDVKWAVDVVNKAVKVSLTQNQFDALVDFTYNVGSYAFRTSTLLRNLNGGNYESVPSQLIRWTNGGQVGLVNRRNYEINLFVNGIYR